MACILFCVRNVFAHSRFSCSLASLAAIDVLLNMMEREALIGIPIEPLAWSLSVGACVGGIGSIMGSSANLVAMSVSKRYAPDDPLKGSDFLKYGFPLLLLLVSIATLYQYVFISWATQERV